MAGKGRAAASVKWRRRRGEDTMVKLTAQRARQQRRRRPHAASAALCVSQAALHILLSTLPTSVAPRGPAAGDAGDEPMRVS